MYPFGCKMVSTKYGELPLSRICFSWSREGGEFEGEGMGRKQFLEWIESIGVSEKDVDEIREIVGWQGKLELERDAANFMRNYAEKSA